MSDDFEANLLDIIVRRRDWPYIKAYMGPSFWKYCLRQFGGLPRLNMKTYLPTYQFYSGKFCDHRKFVYATVF